MLLEIDKLDDLLAGIVLDIMPPGDEAADKPASEETDAELVPPEEEEKEEE